METKTLISDYDQFTQGYLTAAFWSSTEYKYGECPCCGRMAVLDKYPEKEYEEQAMCSAEGCGVREISNPDPLEDNYSISDLAPETLAKILNDCSRFQRDFAELLSQVTYKNPDSTDAARSGHNFWLNRNGHGSGFWDEGLGDVGDKLSLASRGFGEFNLYAGDDGKIYS